MKAQQKKDKLGSHDRELLAKARTKGDKRVTVMLATTKGSTKSVAAAVKAAGGFTATVSEKYGYISASVPVGKVDSHRQVRVRPRGRPQRVDPAAQARGRSDPAPRARPPSPVPARAPRTTTRTCRRATSARWPSRTPTPPGTAAAITIGVIDSGVDLDHPALQTTTTGERKIVDWVTGTDPLLESDGSWRAMLTSVTGPTFTVANARHVDRSRRRHLQVQPRLREHLERRRGGR